MADVRPFRGLRYNPERVGDLASILCPPYDVISPEVQEDLHRRSPHNVVRLEYGQAFPQDDDQDNQYTRAANLFRRWQEEGALLREYRHALYVVEEEFPWRGGTSLRRHIVARVGLEPWERGTILPHEHTKAAPKEDRLRLMLASSANFSPVMGLYRDGDSQVASVLRETTQGPPAATAGPQDGQAYRLWVLDNPEAIATIRGVLADQPLLVADGHHRYETALRYRQLMGPAEDRRWAHDFVMMALIDVADPGLRVLPYHRLLRGLEEQDLSNLAGRLQALFLGESVEVSPASAPEAAARLMERVEGGQQMALAVVGLREGYALLLSPRGDAPKEGTPAVPQGLEECDTWLLQHQVLEPVLGDRLASGPIHIDYTHDAVEAVRRVAQGRDRVAFLLRPLPLEVFQGVVRQGHRLPAKSTYFYPKLPTGLVINPLAGGS